MRLAVGMIVIEYDHQLSRGEINPLENIWRGSINESIRKNNEDISRVLTLQTLLPFEIWMRIFSMVHPPVPMIQDVRSDFRRHGTYMADFLYKDSH